MSNTITGSICLTNGKKMNFELYSDVAPLSVANFVKLAKENFYNGLCFHRVIPGFMVQGGGMVASGKRLQEKRAKDTIKGEFISNGVQNTLKHTPGVLSMARTQVKDSATSQFFICVADTPFLDGEYAGFGKLVGQDSIDIAIEISKVPTTRVEYHDDVPVTAIEIQSVIIN